MDTNTDDLDLDPGEHVAKFLHQLFDGLGGGFRGDGCRDRRSAAGRSSAAYHCGRIGHFQFTSRKHAAVTWVEY